MKKVILALSLFIISTPLMAWHVTSGTVQSINAYAHTSTVLVKLSNVGTAVNECSNTESFAIDGTLPEDRRNQMMSIFLSAKAMGKTVSVAYEETNGCAAYGNNQSAYRKIKRITH